MGKSVLHSVSISLYILFFIAVLIGCDADNNYSDYLLSGNWESASEDDRFTDSTSRSMSTEPEVREASVVPVSITSVSETLPAAVIVRYEEGIEKTQELTSRIGNYGKEIPRAERADFAFSRVEIHSNGTTAIEDIIKYYERLPGVKYAEEDHRVSTQAAVTVNDTYYLLQWNMQQLGMGEAWSITEGSSTVTVAVIDTGIAEDISDFAGTEFIGGWNFVNDTDKTHDDNGHGTHVSGTVAQTTNNGHGTAGMAYGVTLMPVKVLDGSGDGYSSDVAAGILRAADYGADIINLSLAGEGFNQTTYDALAYAYQQKGVTIFAASGNDEAAAVSYPAAYEEYVIAVGATTRDRERAYYSSYGPKLDIVAPGGDISSPGQSESDGIYQQTVMNGDESTEGFYYFEGTSMAAPHAAALGALLLSRNPQLSPAEVYTAITGTAEDLGAAGKDSYYGYGLISPAAALESVPDGISIYTVSDSIHVVYDDAEKPPAQWFFQADSGEIHLTLSSPSAVIGMILYDSEGVEIASTENTSEQEIIHPIGNNGGEFSVVVHWDSL